MVKYVGRVGTVDVFTDDECAQGAIVIYNYGRLFMNPLDLAKNPFNEQRFEIRLIPCERPEAIDEAQQIENLDDLGIGFRKK